MTIISRCIPGIDGGKDRVGFSPPPHTKNKISKSIPHRLIVLHKTVACPALVRKSWVCKGLYTLHPKILARRASQLL